MTFDVKDTQGGAKPPLGPSGSVKKRTISLEAFKIMKVIGKGRWDVCMSMVYDECKGMVYGVW
ncbi:hypothetical protein EON63_19635 [archaeon]|nr:MAG: hypothetical protein EON63_19635 [archaeon]